MNASGRGVTQATARRTEGREIGRFKPNQGKQGWFCAIPQQFQAADSAVSQYVAQQAGCSAVCSVLGTVKATSSSYGRCDASLSVTREGQLPQCGVVSQPSASTADLGDTPCEPFIPLGLVRPSKWEPGPTAVVAQLARIRPLHMQNCRSIDGIKTLTHMHPSTGSANAVQLHPRSTGEYASVMVKKSGGPPAIIHARCTVCNTRHLTSGTTSFVWIVCDAVAAQGSGTASVLVCCFTGDVALHCVCFALLLPNQCHAV